MSAICHASRKGYLNYAERWSHLDNDIVSVLQHLNYAERWAIRSWYRTSAEPL